MGLGCHRQRAPLRAFRTDAAAARSAVGPMTSCTIVAPLPKHVPGAAARLRSLVYALSRICNDCRERDGAYEVGFFCPEEKQRTGRATCTRRTPAALVI